MSQYIRHPEQPVAADIKLVDGLFIKTYVVPKAGTILPQHSHEFDHVTLLAHGAMLVWADDAALGEHAGPCGILIRARVKHRFETLTDGVVLACIHRVGETGDVAIHEENNVEIS